jgi:Flp pilus assembly protein TadD
MTPRTLDIRDSSGRTHQISIPQAMEFAAGFCRAGDRKSAELIYHEAVKTRPVAAGDLHALGTACYQLGDYEAALRHYREALTGAPRDASLHCNIGVTLARLRRFEEACVALQTAVSLSPSRPDIHSNLADLLTEMRRYEEALVHCRKAVDLDPALAGAQNNLGRVLEYLGRFEEAGAAFRNAAQGDLPEAHFNYSLHLLRTGDYLQGFREYEWRWRCNGFPSGSRAFQRPLWDGSDLSGKTILIHAEQGFGDTLQFVRFLPQVAARHGRVLFQVQPELRTLLADFPGVWRVVSQGEPLPPFDCHCPLLSLPRLLETRVDTIPADAPYLKPDAARAASWQSLRKPGCLHVGLVWSGSAANTHNHSKSLPLAAFAPLGAIAGISWHSLQKGSAAEAAAPPPGMLLQNLEPHLKDFSDTAAILSNLDLLITMDTAIAHLAGALGTPVWVLLPFVADWRWMRDREDSPWYPAARLFRQTAAEDWQGVVGRVRPELDRLAGTRLGTGL